MAGKRRRYNPEPVSDLVSRILDPVLAKRAGITTSLLQAWDEIVGEQLAAHSRPQQIKWSRQASDDDPFEPATLIIACEAMAALHIQHQTTEIIGRVNSFMGYAAIDRVRIVQKPVANHAPAKTPLPPIPAEKGKRIQETVRGVDNDGLRDALEKLGRNIASER